MGMREENNGCRQFGKAGRTEELLRAFVLRYRPEVFFAGELKIGFHQNTCTMASLSRRGRRQSLRLHRLFTQAPPSVLEAVVRSFFTRAPHGQAQRLRERIFDFLAENESAAGEWSSPFDLGSSRGRVHDLEEVQEAIRRDHLPQCPRLRIGWSRRASASLMGKWLATPAGLPSVVVVNRLLDDPRVPRYYVEYVVFHELLHELIPIRRERGRWVRHPVEFRRLERQFPSFREAVDWEQANVWRLFSAFSDRERVLCRVREA
jgi:hypothetical protein